LNLSVHIRRAQSNRGFAVGYSGMTMTDTTWRETIHAKGHELLEQIRKLISEGNVRRIIVRHDHHVIAEFPLTAGVVGVVLAPMLAAVGAIAAIVTECTVDIEREGKRPPNAT